MSDHICKRCREYNSNEDWSDICEECIWTDQTYGQDQMEE